MNNLIKIFSTAFVLVGIICLFASVWCLCYWFWQQESGLGSVMAFFIASSVLVVFGGFLMQFVKGD
jgi:hypothetical protein